MENQPGHKKMNYSEEQVLFRAAREERTTMLELFKAILNYACRGIKRNFAASFNNLPLREVIILFKLMLHFVYIINFIILYFIIG